MYGLKVPRHRVRRSHHRGLDPEGVVGDGLALQEVHAEIAQIRHAGLARRTLAARRDEGQDDVVADLEALDALTQLDDLAGTLVSTGTGKPARGMPPVIRWWSVASPGMHLDLLTSWGFGSPISISSIFHGVFQFANQRCLGLHFHPRSTRALGLPVPDDCERSHRSGRKGETRSSSCLNCGAARAPFQLCKPASLLPKSARRTGLTFTLTAGVTGQLVDNHNVLGVLVAGESLVEEGFELLDRQISPSATTTTATGTSPGLASARPIMAASVMRGWLNSVLDSAQ